MKVWSVFLQKVKTTLHENMRVSGKLVKVVLFLLYKNLVITTFKVQIHWDNVQNAENYEINIQPELSGQKNPIKVTNQRCDVN